ncbi:GNAT family N-acetyltransferase [Chitinophaga sp. 22321]|uniref:GNAT family N-acetyltransferase n=1 Tax=Chitinophaga hostae TaxID=2831022 RepID=A0ABS5IU56_9BACT|nr:GNAT family N-acetyltransferase [Chitinophaga hostae]MBS0026413.1 GNAT family N-acetyltransferase [Chitinophaga hostae]
MSDIIKANLDNLISLWKTAGTPFNGFVDAPLFSYCRIENADWPNRLWFRNDVTPEALDAALEVIGETKTTIPYFDICNSGADEYIAAKGGVLAFEQAGMSIKLEQPFTVENSLTYVRISDNAQAELWAALYPQAFGYTIGAGILMSTCNDLHFYLAYYNGVPAGTAILHCRDGIAGIHGVGVIPEMRNKGLAREIMGHVLNEAIGLNAAYATLQASKMGIGIYLKMGFEEQFQIRNYRVGSW